MKGLYVLKEKRIYKRELPLWGSLLAAVLLAGCITLLALWCQPNALRTVLAGFKAQPLLIVLNALPIGLLLLAFAFLFRNVFYSGALVNFFVCALSLANRVKIEVRDEPVFPRDFSLLREVGSAIQSYDIRYPVKAIEMQVYRSSGAGGQHINKTSSAVRLIHKPTGIVVSCQTQRSQFQNRDYAMEMLKAKLYQIAKQQHMDKIDDIKGVQNEIAWGHQIRSYVFMPYTMVKDHRTNYETGNVDAVMDGDLDGFIFAYLKAASRGELQDA